MPDCLGIAVGLDLVAGVGRVLGDLVGRAVDELDPVEEGLSDRAEEVLQRAIGDESILADLGVVRPGAIFSRPARSGRHERGRRRK